MIKDVVVQARESLCDFFFVPYNRAHCANFAIC